MTHVLIIILPCHFHARILRRIAGLSCAYGASRYDESSPYECAGRLTIDNLARKLRMSQQTMRNRMKEGSKTCTWYEFHEDACKVIPMFLPEGKEEESAKEYALEIMGAYFVTKFEGR